jgi:exonuclease SbcC
MRPRVLTVSAFGPFAGTEVIDFRPLRGRDLLLIEGPTGAGKTAILDAMTYALYGTLPGPRDQARHELKSAWADPTARCEVRFELELGERVYRVARAPQQERAKKRGGGLTTERAEASLVEVVGEREVPIAAGKIADVDARVAELVGLTAEQFKQVLLLPQGEFRRFLLATSQEKEELLERLFATTAYKDVAEHLRDEQLRLERRAGEIGRARAELLGGRGVTTIDELRARIGETRARIDALGAQADTAAAEAAGARERSGAASRLAARFDELGKARAELADVARGADKAGEARRILGASDRAQPLAPGFERVALAHANVSRREAEVVARDLVLQSARTDAERGRAAAALLPARRTRLDELVAAGAALAALEPVEQAAHAALDELTAARRLHVDSTKRLAAARAELDETRVALRDNEAAISRSQEEAAGEPALRVESEQVGGAAERRAVLAQEEARFAEARRIARDTEQQHQARRAELDAARAASIRARALREANLAAELAGRLVAGEACPVCGAKEHPRPAARTAEAVGLDEIRVLEEKAQKADDFCRKAEKKRVDAAANVKIAEARVKEQRASMGAIADESPLELSARARELAARLASARAAAARIVTLGVERGALAARAAAGEQRVQALGDDAQAREREAAVLKARLDELFARLRAHVAEGQGVAGRARDVAAERERLAAEITRTEATAQRTEAALEAETRLRGQADAALVEERLRAGEAAVELGREASALGFADPTEAQRVLLPVSRAAELRDRLAAWETRRASAAARVEDLECELGDGARPDAEALAAEALAAETRARATQTELGEVKNHLGELERAEQAAAVHGAEYDRIAETLRVFGRVSRVVSGENRLRMSLQRFVLASRMDEVAIAASERLVRMSRGRYRLRRTDAVKHGARGSGLDLVVEDRQTGQDRSVHSLSGGEMFLSSLSLAMGLSDSVQAHAGGVRLDSLFIDEGFGTLDDETLDQVMRTLEDLRAGGRLVGVISHVAELKERLQTRISVTKGGKGSTARLVMA